MRDQELYMGLAVAALILLGNQSRSATSTPSPLYLDRGMKNNNPGNIKKGPSIWQGEVRPGNDPVFVQFQTMPYGIRATLKLLLNYFQVYGLNTTDGIIRRWSATDRTAYVNFVSACLGVSPVQKLTPTGQFLKRLANCVFDFENKYQKPSWAEIEQGYAML